MTYQFSEQFAAFVAQQDPVPRELDELSATLVKRWRLSNAAGPQGYNTVTRVKRLAAPGSAALDSLDRTGDIPQRVTRSGAKNPVWRFHRALGRGTSSD
ncbi:hypothetical protein [Streptomyces sp. NBC_00203]|uniref:hypothetical protein n=1 Tax=Streptomyces sp. NBC_00203 TaxID=2975680 RepID=UPI003252D727